jgi:plasmid stability protein
MQYTVRNIPADLDRALKARAKKTGKSVNQLALEALSQSVGLAPKRRNLRDMPGAWSKREATEFDKFLAQHRRIDEELWK